MNELPQHLALAKIYYDTPATTQVPEIRLVNRPIRSGDLLSPCHNGNRNPLTKGNALEARLTKLFTLSNDSNYRREIESDRLRGQLSAEQRLVRCISVSKSEFGQNTADRSCN